MDRMLHASYSQLSTWRRCRLRYHWHYVDGFSPQTSALGLRMGKAGHEGLMVWYGTGEAEDAIDAARTVWLAEGPLEPDEHNWSRLETILRRYIPWAERNDPWTEIVAVEEKISLPLPGGKEFIAIIDVIARAGDELWIMDHKFVKRADHSHLLLDTQMSTYMAALAVSGAYGMPAGAVYNSILTTIDGKAATEPVRRTPVRRSPFSATLAWEEIIKQSAELDIYWGAGPAERELMVYRNCTRDCHWDCSFYSACLALEHDGDPLPVLRDGAEFKQRGGGYELVLDDVPDIGK